MKEMFCENCEKLLEIEINQEGKVIGKCICGFNKKILSSGISEKIKKKEEIGKGIIKEEKITKGFPHDCKKCNYPECDIFLIGAPYADESEIYLYRCKKCKYVERQADGTGNA